MGRLIGNPPTLGLYGTIDPRTYPVKGVPEGSVKASQLSQVMARLGQVRKIAEAVRLYDGTNLNVVVGSMPVGGPAEAAGVQAEFERAGVTCTLNSSLTWSMGSETFMTGHPEWIHGIEVMNGTSWPGAVFGNSARASLNAHGRPVYYMYPRDVEEPGSDICDAHATQITNFLRSAAAMATMRGKSYLSVGHVSMGIGGSEVISDIWDRYLGMKTVHVDQVEVAERMRSGMYDAKEAKRASEWFKRTFAGRIDPRGVRGPGVIDVLIEKLVVMTLIIRDMMEGNPNLSDEERAAGKNAIAAGTAGQRYWTDWHPNWDFTEALLSSSFDWNGPRTPGVVATENDALNGMCMLFGLLLTGLTQLFADLRTYWSPDVIRRLTGQNITGVAPTGFLHLINSGPAALDWATDPQGMGAEHVQAACEGTIWEPASLGYFPNDGLSSHFVTPGDVPVTLVRMNRVGLQLTLTIIEGYTIALPNEVAQHVRMRTDPTWPDTFVVPRGDLDLNGIYEFGQATKGDAYHAMSEAIDPNHVVACPGHVGDLFLTLSSMARIPVDYHNVEQGRVFRPTLWKLLGGDRAACEKLGPLYC